MEQQVPSIYNDLKLDESQQLSPHLKQKKISANVYHLNGRDYDLEVLKEKYSKTRAASNKEFQQLTKSTEFDAFLKKTISYCRWYSVYLILDFSINTKKSSQIPSVLSKHILDLSKQSLFGEKNAKIPKALAYKSMALKELGKAYCFLLLAVSNAQRASSEERQWFEIWYAMIRDIVKEILEMPALHSILDSELDRLWRSENFAKKTDLDIGQITFDVFGRGVGMSKAQTSFRTRRQSESHTRKKSIAPTSSESLGDKDEALNDWKLDLPSSSLQWLSKKASSFNNDWDAPGKAIIVEGEDETEDSIHPSLFMKRKKINMIEVRLTRSPLLDSVSQKPPRFLFTNRSANISQLIGD